MKAVFIAAGEGSRMGNLTTDTPKPLVDVNGKSILERQIRILNNKNINEILIITGPFAEKYKFENVSYINDQKFNEHDQLGSLAAAIDHITDDVLIIFGDILFDESILKQVCNNDSDVVIAVDMDWKKYENRNQNSISDADKVAINNKSIKRIFKTMNENDQKYSIGEFLGLIKLNHKGSQAFRRIFSKLLETHRGRFHDAESLNNAKVVDFLQEMLEQRIDIKPEIIDGEWCEIDTIQDLEIAKKIFRE